MGAVSVEDVLRMLRTTIERLEFSHRRPVEAPCFPKLAEIAAKLDAPGVARVPVGIEEYVRQWHGYLGGKDGAPELKAIRVLCWHPETATDRTFQYYLDHHQVSLSSRSLQGMVYSCHARWSPQFAAGEIPRKVRARLERYDGPNRLLAKWKQMAEIILGNSGTTLLGGEMLKDPQPIKEFCSRWGLSEDTPYIQAGVASAAELCRRDMDRVAGLREYLTSELLSWQRWPPDRFKQEVSKTILHPAANAEEVRTCLSRFVVSKETLGDPRLPLNDTNWAGIRDAERRVIEWFSQRDIAFFFEHVLPRGSDPHGRKEFWLRYVGRVQRSRPLLSWPDRSRLNRGPGADGLDSIALGKMADSQVASSFLLDFGSIVAVEFSQVGNACYLYSKTEAESIIGDFWKNDPFKATDLKNPQTCLAKIVHRKSKSQWHGGGWQEELAQILARNGIRP
jgi:hypothetical protein